MVSSGQGETLTVTFYGVAVDYMFLGLTTSTDSKVI